MHRGIKSVLLFLTALALAGCQPAGGQQTEKESETAAEKETAAAAEKETAAAAETESAETEERIHTVIGVLEDFTAEQIQILSDNGNELFFSAEHAEIDLPCGIRIGNMVSVDYVGEIMPAKGQAEPAPAVRVAGSADVAETKADGGEPETGTEDRADTAAETNAAEETEKTEKTIEGALVNLEMGTIQMKTEDGKEQTFRTVNVPVYFACGMRKGMSVRLVCRGGFTKGDSAEELSEEIEVLRIEDGGKAQNQEIEQPVQTDQSETQEKDGQAETETPPETAEKDTEAEDTEAEDTKRKDTEGSGQTEKEDGDELILTPS